MNRLLDLTEESDLQSHTHINDELKMTILPLNDASGYVTDKDLEDEDGSGMFCNFLASMLLAPAELESKGNNDNDNETEDNDIDLEKKKQRKNVLFK